MTHMVIHRSAEGQPVYHETKSLEEAARHVEHLRNAGQGSDARIFAMHEVPIEVKTYYKVELPTVAEAAEAAAPAPAPEEAPAAAPVAEAAAAAAPVVETPAGKGEPAAAGANGGRFGLFGKG